MVTKRILDLRGMISSFAILKAGAAVRELEPHETMEILLSDLETIKDLTKVLQGSAIKVTFDPSLFLVKAHKNSNTITRRNPMSQTLTEAPQVAAVVDARGSACPGPLLEAKKAIGKVKVEEILEIISSDPGTKDDIPMWANKVGHDFMGFVPQDGYDRLFVRRKK